MYEQEPRPGSNLARERQITNIFEGFAGALNGIKEVVYDVNLGLPYRAAQAIMGYVFRES